MKEKTNKSVVGNSDASSITLDEIQSLISLNYLFSSALLELSLNVNHILKLPADTSTVFKLHERYDDYFIEIEHVSHTDTGHEAIRIKPIKRSINH